jgi:hypothetical protein
MRKLSLMFRAWSSIFDISGTTYRKPVRALFKPHNPNLIVQEDFELAAKDMRAAYEALRTKYSN